MPSNTTKDIKEIVSLCKRRGFIFQGSEIYGGLANSWDYGPLGAQLKKNIKDYFWKVFVQKRDDIYPIDSSILMHPKVWEASGHLENFKDPLIDCKDCKERFRADKLIEETTSIKVEGLNNQKLSEIIENNQNIKCPNCGAHNFTPVRSFNLMFKTYQGVVEGEENIIYLRPETAQGIFINFLNILNTTRAKLPFGVAQIGKSFRNEITPGNFIFRTREFEQIEIEYFVKPGEELEYFEKWKDDFYNFFLNLGINKDNLRIREHEKDELSHYSNKTIDFEYNFPWGYGELMGIASRTDYDLKRHIEYSGVDLVYFDPYNQQKLIPYVIEPSLGVERLLLVLLIDSFEIEKLPDGTERNLLKLSPKIAPIKAAILPLKKNEPRIVNYAKNIFNELSDYFDVMYDDTAAIGKLYRRQDEIGTPFCITVDFQTIEEDNKVTIRDRDSMQQIRVDRDKIKDCIFDKIKY
ncbi:MAG: glycine--tRNA ligase [Spirochaetes bacterium]|nr:glycine--tRNA ligase [Spirochaetota bacterium]